MYWKIVYIYLRYCLNQANSTLHSFLFNKTVLLNRGDQLKLFPSIPNICKGTRSSALRTQPFFPVFSVFLFFLLTDGTHMCVCCVCVCWVCVRVYVRVLAGCHWDMDMSVSPSVSQSLSRTATMTLSLPCISPVSLTPLLFLTLSVCRLCLYVCPLPVCVSL